MAVITFGMAVEQGWRLELCRLEESPLGTGERTLKIDRLKPVGPILDCGTVGLGGLLVRTQDLLRGVGWVKLEPPLPSSVNSLFAADPHDVSSVAICDLRSMFPDKHGVDLRN
jgi:hypothetical protein